MRPKSEQLGTLPVGSLLTSLSLPAMGAMIIMSLYNIVDTVFVGHGVGAAAIGGLGIVFPMQMLFIAIGFFFGFGGASLYSRALGAGRTDEARRALGNTIAGAAITGFALFLIMLIFRDPILTLFGARESMLARYAREYYDIIIFGIPFLSVTVAGNNIIRAAGHARTAMLTMLISALMNTVLDPVFIFGFKLGVGGAAWATIIAQALTMVWILGYFRSRHAETRLTWSCLHFRLPVLREIMAVGAASLARQAAQSVYLAVFNNLFLHHGGAVAVTAFGTIFRPLSLAIMPLFGIAQALQPIAGYNYGAGKIPRVKESFRLAWRAGTVYAIAAATLFLLFPEPFLRMFIKEADLLQDPKLLIYGKDGIRALMVLFPLAGYQIMAGGLFQAVGRAVPALITSISRQLIFLLPLGLILPRLWGFTGVLLAFPAAELLGLVLSLFLVRSEMRLLDRAGTRPA